MSFANINIGTTPGDHSGDPLRVAFNKINNNFQQIANGNVDINVSAPVQSVAGRTGNIVLTAADVIGSITMGNVQAAMNDFAASYVTKNDLAANILSVTGTVVSGLNTLEKIATTLGNNTSFGSDVISNLATKTTQITALQSNAVIQQESLNYLSDSIIAANLAIAQNASDIQDLFSNAANQADYLSNLTANAASQGTYLTGLTSNAAVQAASLDTLTANAVAQQTTLISLFANAATQDASLTTLIANAVAQQTTLSNLLANVTYIEGQIDGANAAIITANTAMKGYVDVQIAAVNQGWGANAESVQSQLTAANTAIVTANTAMKSYSDAQDALVTSAWTANAVTTQSQLTAANTAIVTANTAMKGYVDARETAITNAWTANAAAQEAAITSLVAGAYTNSNVAAYLPTHTGNVTGKDVLVTGNIQTSGNFTISKHQFKGYTSIGNYVEGTQTAALLVNASASQPLPSLATMQVVGPVTGIPAQIVLDAHSSVAGTSYLGRRSRGNVTAPTALQTGDLISTFAGKGYGSTGFNSATAPGFSVFAAENFTDTAQGTYSVISYTTPGSTNTIHHTRFDSNGNVLIVGGSTSTSPTTGALVINGGVGISGNLHLTGNIQTLNSITTLSDINASGLVYANSQIVSNTAVYSPQYYFANGAPLSFPFDTVSATSFIKNYGGNVYIANMQMRNSTITGDGSALPLTLDYTQTIANHILQAEGELIANASIQATSAYNGAFQIPNGGAGIQGNLFCAIQPDTRIQAGQGGAYLPNVIGQFTSDVNGYSQVNMQNLHHGSFASSDFVVTADNGSDTENFGDFGIANSQYMYPGYEAILPNDTYVIANGGNLLINAGSPTKAIKFAVGGSDVTDIVGNWSNVALTVSTNLDVLGDISYTPANASNWNTSITSISQALDELAERLRTAGF